MRVVLHDGLVAVEGQVHDPTHATPLVLLLTRVHPQVYRMHVRPVLRVEHQDALVTPVTHQHHLVVGVEGHAPRVDLEVSHLTFNNNNNDNDNNTGWARLIPTRLIRTRSIRTRLIQSST